MTDLATDHLDQDDDVHFSGSFSDTGYILPAGLSYEEWAAEGGPLIRMARSSMWWVGDWIRYGEANYGERYAQAIEATGLALQTLRNYVWVCDRIPPSERDPDVPFSHHRAAAALDPEDRREVITRAREEGLAEHEVRAAVKEIKEAAAAAGAPPPPEDDPPDFRSPLTRAAVEAVALLHDAESAGDWTLAAQARALLEDALDAEEPE